MRDVVKVQSEPPRPQRPRRRRRNLTLHYALFIAAAVVLFLILSRTVLFRINEYDISEQHLYERPDSERRKPSVRAEYVRYQP